MALHGNMAYGVVIRAVGSFLDIDTFWCRWLTAQNVAWVSFRYSSDIDTTLDINHPHVRMQDGAFLTEEKSL